MKQIILILLLQLTYVPLLTLRTIFMVKNMSVIASSIGFVEVLVYITGLSLVFNGEQNTLARIVYAGGYGLGIFVGGCIEQKLAIGYTTLVVYLASKNEQLISCLRNEGFGVTIFEGEGRDNKRYRLDILTKRNREKELLKLIEMYEPRAFIISYEPRRFKGGFLANTMKKRMKNRNDMNKSIEFSQEV